MMDSGSLVEEGTHQELIQQQGRYYALYSQQEADLTDTDLEQQKNSNPCPLSSGFGKVVLLCRTRPSLVIGADLALFGIVWWHINLGLYCKNRPDCHCGWSS